MRKPKEQQKAKPVFFSCNIKFPERFWDLTSDGWISRPVTTQDQIAREELAIALHAVVLP